MAKKSRRRTSDNVALEMTPMIDVVFQLLIFFLVTLETKDMMAKLDTLRPAPASSNIEEEKEPPLEIVIDKNNISCNGSIVTEAQLEEYLEGMYEITKEKTMVLIKSTGDAPHMYLVRVLDICSKLHINQISLFSLYKT